MSSSSDPVFTKKRLRSADDLYLIGSITHQILGAKLPSNRQVLSVFFYNTRILKLSASESATLVGDEVAIFYCKARIPTASQYNNAQKVERLVESYKDLQKSANKITSVQSEKEKAFVAKLDDLFDMSHRDAMTLIRSTEVRDFLIAQRQKGRVGCLIGVEKKEQAKEDARELRREQEKARIIKAANGSMKNGNKTVH